MSVDVLELPLAAPRAKRMCRHCGAGLIDARMIETGFCCAGCSYVFRLVHEHGLAGYYRIKDDVTAPADAAVFQARDYAWLETLQAAAEAAAGTVTGSPGRHDSKAATAGKARIRGKGSNPHFV
jgi:Cu2+-exporting ATPase